MYKDIGKALREASSSDEYSIAVITGELFTLLLDLVFHLHI